MPKYSFLNIIDSDVKVQINKSNSWYMHRNLYYPISNGDYIFVNVSFYIFDTVNEFAGTSMVVDRGLLFHMKGYRRIFGERDVKWTAL